MATAPIIVIDMQEGLYWGDCPMCGQEKRLDHAVGWYEEAVHEDIGTILPHGGEVGGKSVCRECHDRHYAPGARPMTDTHTTPTAEELAARIEPHPLTPSEGAMYIRAGLARDAAHVIRAQKLHADRVDRKLVEMEAQIAELTAELGTLRTVTRIADSAAEARATTAEAALAAMTAERDASEAKRKDADREWTKHYSRMTRAEAAAVAANATVAAIADDLCCEASRDETTKAIVALQGERNGLREALSASLDREMAMREALEPFAKAANLWDGPPGVCYHDSLQLWQTNGPVDYLTCGDLRAARAALQTKEDVNGR